MVMSIIYSMESLLRNCSRPLLSAIMEVWVSSIRIVIILGYKRMVKILKTKRKFQIAAATYPMAKLAIVHPMACTSLQTRSQAITQHRNRSSLRTSRLVQIQVRMSTIM
jgi:hypothetical protein